MNFQEKVVAVAYTAGWMLASSGLILLNKYILSTLKFHYPLTLCRRACAVRRRSRAQGLTRDAAPRAVLGWGSRSWRRRR
jgi:hypothetical protein